MEKDSVLFIVSVIERPWASSLYWYSFSEGGKESEDYARMQDRMTKNSRMLLNRFGELAKEAGVNYHLVLGVTNDVKEFLCRIVDEKVIELMIVGRRGISGLKRLFVGSVSQYCLDHANCNVLVIKNYNEQEKLSKDDFSEKDQTVELLETTYPMISTK